ncbi:glycosyltransferase family 61 protein [Ruegeria arenilitoris]|uniref:glycosyltransferase family 61 protein n=1 Tax=Ruegeria arenilitoris TaxID=1173585 RepID=UPI00148187DB|nr:glycosyltransferase family 61 protein [Ruegeria arenilitoris]
MADWMIKDDFSALAFSGRYEEALAICRANVPDIAADHAASFIAGYCNFHMGRPDDAAQHFAAALELAGGDTFSMSYLVKSLNAAGFADEALARGTEYIIDWHGDGASDNFGEMVQAGIESLTASHNAALRSEFLTALRARSANLPSDKEILLATATLYVEGLDATRRQLGSQITENGRIIAAPLLSVSAGVAAGLGRFLWQQEADTIRIAAFEGAPFATTSGVQATVAGYRAYVVELRDAFVSGESSAVFGPAGEILSDTYADTRFGEAVDLRADAILKRRHGDAALLCLPQPTQRIDQAINLAGLASNHFGHWFSEFLPRLRHIAKLPECADLPILVNEDMPETHFDFLAQLCDNPLIRLARGEVVQVSRLIVAPTIGFYPFDLKPGHNVPIEEQAAWSGPAMRFVRDRVLSTLGNQTPAQKNAIYLTRSHSSWGRPFNEDDVLAHCPKAGLRPVRLETMDFVQQVKTIQSATTIVAPTGSALNMLIFAHPETKIIIFTQKYPHNWGGWVGPIREIGLNPCMIMSTTGDPNVKHASYDIDIDLLRDLVAPNDNGEQL